MTHFLHSGTIEFFEEIFLPSIDLDKSDEVEHFICGFHSFVSCFLQLLISSRIKFAVDEYEDTHDDDDTDASKEGDSDEPIHEEDTDSQLNREEYDCSSIETKRC